DNKSVQRESLAIETNGVASQWRVARRPKGETKWGEYDEAERRNRQCGDADREPIEMRGACGPPLRPDAENAIIAAGNLDPLERDGPDDLRECQGQHRKVHSGQLNREKSEHRRASKTQQR